MSYSFFIIYTWTKEKKTFIRICVLILLAVVLIVMIKFYCDLIKDKYSNLSSNGFTLYVNGSAIN